jgi:hypothetical protein
MKQFTSIYIAFLIIAAGIFGIGLTKAYYSSQQTVSSMNLTMGTWATSTPTATLTASPTPAKVVINEFMANPPEMGAAESNTEWVELYNVGGSGIDINGWVLYDAFDSHALPISSANITSGSTVIDAGGYAVVNRNGDADFSLNNDADTVRLFDGVIGAGTLINSISYTGTIEGKTWARMPNGTGGFTDGHTPKPGEANV